MKTNELKKVISSYVEKAIDYNKRGESYPTLFIQGRPGIGKSEIIKQIAEERGYGLKVAYLSTMLLEQMTGLPMPGKDGKEVNWSKPELFDFSDDKMVLPWKSTKQKSFDDKERTNSKNEIIMKPKTNTKETPKTKPTGLEAFSVIPNTKKEETKPEESKTQVKPENTDDIKQGTMPTFDSVTNGFDFAALSKSLGYDDNTIIERDKEDNPLILVLDDAHLINKQMQSYLFQLPIYRRINTWKLPDNVVIIMAGNSKQDKANAQTILAPVVNRIMFIEMEANKDQWLNDYAIPNRLHPSILSFFQSNSYDHMFLGEPLENQPWSSPRAWKYLSDMLYTLNEFVDDTNKLRDIVFGIVGPESGGKFIEHHELFAKWNYGDLISTPDWKVFIEENKIKTIDVYSITSVLTSSLINRVIDKKDVPGEIIQVRKYIEALQNTQYKPIITFGLKNMLFACKDNKQVRYKIMREFINKDISKMINNLFMLEEKTKITAPNIKEIEGE